MLGGRVDTMHPNPAAVAAAAPPLPPVWSDARFQVPLALLGATVLATATFTVLHFALRKRPTPTPEHEGVRDEKGWSFPELGYVLCPQGSGLDPTAKEIKPGSIVIVALGSPTGLPVEASWGRVAEVDPRDPNRVLVVLVGQATTTGQTDLQTDRHGFRISAGLWVTRDCVWDVLEALNDPRGYLLCGAELMVWDGPDNDTTPDGHQPVALPAPPRQLVGREIELFFVSRAGKGLAWQVPIRAVITDVTGTGHVATVRVLAVGTDEFADVSGHQVTSGDTFDITWDCVVKYL
jgi:hypothetical protein